MILRGAVKKANMNNIPCIEWRPPDAMYHRVDRGGALMLTSPKAGLFISRSNRARWYMVEEQSRVSPGQIQPKP